MSHRLENASFTVNALDGLVALGLGPSAQQLRLSSSGPFQQRATLGRGQPSLGDRQVLQTEYRLMLGVSHVNVRPRMVIDP